VALTRRPELTDLISIRLAPEDTAALDALASAIAVATRRAIARAALRLGIAKLQRNPAKLLGTKRLKRPAR
jgi:predicted transcriptional regulator